MQRVCDRVGIVRAGRLIAVERVADLLGKAAAGRGRARRAGVDSDALRDCPGSSDLTVEDGRSTFQFAR